ncbi:alpha/beta hydrolase [Gracilimonas sp. BCB1]|uniref:alpha/beta hydrolase n=1 Tax=Gracilimonas sp. BCB1 TaxID=3152362 RepID=UPI0032D997C2
MRNVSISEKASFNLDVPYKLIETGDKGKKPLIVYLHGYNQNIEYFEKKAEPMLTLRAYHLFIQAPYPIYDKSRNRKVEKWGRAWYLYDGSQEQFIKSMEKASVLIQDIIEDVKEECEVNRLGVFGYSMGGYLGGYFALSRFKHVNDLIVIGGRIKTEAFEGQREQAKHIHILALHGEDDDSVYPDPQKKCIELLKQEGFNAEFKLVEAGHKLEPIFIEKSKDWLKESGYVESS